MSTNNVEDNIRPTPDQELINIADYVHDYQVTSNEALDTARNCLMDSLACALMALQHPEAAKHLGPIVPGTIVPNGARVPGTSFQLDPVKAAWDIGALVRWLDFNDTWLAAEWGHPSDNLGAILSVADYVSRNNQSEGQAPLSMHDVLTAMIKAHEIQGVLALENSYNKVGLDHVLLVRIASTAVVTQMLGGNKEQVIQPFQDMLYTEYQIRVYHIEKGRGTLNNKRRGSGVQAGGFRGSVQPLNTYQDIRRYSFQPLNTD